MALDDWLRTHPPPHGLAGLAASLAIEVGATSPRALTIEAGALTSSFASRALALDAIEATRWASRGGDPRVSFVRATTADGWVAIWWDDATACAWIEELVRVAIAELTGRVLPAPS